MEKTAGRGAERNTKDNPVTEAQGRVPGRGERSQCRRLQEVPAHGFTSMVALARPVMMGRETG